MDVRIRAATRADHEVIWQATMETVWTDLPPETRRSVDRRAFESHFRPHAKRVIESPNNAILVAEVSGAVVGYAIVGPATSMLSPSPFGFVYDLWVAPEARRQRVGRALLQQAEAWCRGRGLGALRLEVSATNEGARAFYRTQAFAEERLYLVKAL